MLTRRLLSAGMAGLGFSAPGNLSAQTRIGIPIAMAPPRRIVTSLTISGEGPFYFIVDTGAFISGINPSLARKLKMLPVDRLYTQGLGGGGYTQIYAAKDIVFGERFRIPAMDMGGFETYEKADFDGLLAAGFLTAVPSQLDFEQKEISFYPDGKGLDLTGYHKWPSRRQREGAGEKIFVDVSVDGLTANCLLDTGARPAVNLSSSFVAKNKLWDRYKVFEDRVAGGIHGDKIKTRYTHAETMEIGGFPIKGAPLTLYDPKAGENLGGADGIIGMGAIGRFNHIFAPDGLYVKPNAYFEDVDVLFGKPQTRK